MANGTRCPNCHCAQSEVVKVMPYTLRWQGKQKEVTKRYRTCTRCGTSYPSIETTEEELLTMIHPEPQYDPTLRSPRD
jgi:transcriptional regulator NrdR family protein